MREVHSSTAVVVVVAYATACWRGTASSCEGTHLQVTFQLTTHRVELSSGGRVAMWMWIAT